MASPDTTSSRHHDDVTRSSRPHLKPSSGSSSVTTSTPARCTSGSVGVTVLLLLAPMYSSVLDGHPLPPAPERPEDRSWGLGGRGDRRRVWGAGGRRGWGLGGGPGKSR
jgi:hypothetical protein